MPDLTEDKPDWRIEAGKKGQAARKANIAAWSARRKQHNAEEHRQSIKVGMLLSKLESAAQGKVKLSVTQVTACKALLDKAIPTLSAVEAHVVSEPAATRSEQSLLDDLKSLITAYPELVRSLLPENQPATLEHAQVPDDSTLLAPDIAGTDTL